MKTISVRSKCCRLWHRWKREYSYSSITYQSCKDCSARAVEHTRSDIKLVDWDWVFHGRDRFKKDKEQ